MFARNAGPFQPDVIEATLDGGQNTLAIVKQVFDTSHFLANLSLFGGASKDQIARVAAGSRLSHFPRDCQVFGAGDPCESFYIVVIGQVKLFLLSIDGQEKVVEIISAGQSFAESRVFLDKPTTLSAQTLKNTVLINVSKKCVIEEIGRDAQFAMHMLTCISKREHALVQDIEGYALNTGRQRLIGYLLRDMDVHSLKRQNTITVTLPAAKAIVASRLSLTPEYFSMILHELKAQNLVKIARREVCVPNVQSLIEYGSQKASDTTLSTSSKHSPTRCTTDPPTRAYAAKECCR
jgi:CRP-like cAMP-binding protein